MNTKSPRYVAKLRHVDSAGKRLRVLMSCVIALALMVAHVGSQGLTRAEPAGSPSERIVSGPYAFGDDGDDDDDGGDFDDDDDFVPAPAPQPQQPAPQPQAPAPPPQQPAPPVQQDVDDDDFTSDDDDGGPAVTQPATAERVIVDDDDNPTTDGYVATEVIVQLQPGGLIGFFNARNGTETIASIPGRDIHLLRLPPVADVDAEIGQLYSDPDILWAELNYVQQAPEGRPQELYVSAAEPVSDPGESYIEQLLGLPIAHSCATGAGVTVAVIDTGVDPNHPALVDRLMLPGINVLTDGPADDSGNGLDDDGDGEIDEMIGHGTHVAGIISIVAPGAMILPVTALDSDGVGDAFFLAEAIYAAMDVGVDVINLSLGSTRDTIIVASAVADANAAGVVVVAAAGNVNRTEPLEYPAADPNAIGVAATDIDGMKTLFSNYGPTVDIAAPGIDIVSTYPGGTYANWSGTSMATPIVSATAALMLDANPDLTPASLSDRMMATAVLLDEANPTYRGRLGGGRVDPSTAAGCVGRINLPGGAV